MKLFGLTGGIGMGKSASAEVLRARGIAVIDTDQLARRVVEPGEPGFDEVKAMFGEEMIAPDGRLRRDALARKVFSDPRAREELERLLHPRIRRLWKAEVQAWSASGLEWGVVVIPLLFETDAASEFDATLCVACSAGTQLDRLRDRGWSQQQIDQRLAAQWPIEEKIHRSDYVVWAEGGLDLLGAQLSRIVPWG